MMKHEDKHIIAIIYLS